jgi:hypothetical protein
VGLDPHDAEAFASRGSLRRARGDDAGAAADYRAALRAAPAEWVHRAAVERELAAVGSDVAEPERQQAAHQR